MTPPVRVHGTIAGPLLADLLSGTPQTVYAGTGAGVFKRENGGETWSAINEGLTNTAIRALAVDPLVPTVYAATFGGGVFFMQH